MKLYPLDFQLSVFVIEKLLPDLPRRGVCEYDNFWAIPEAFNHRFIQKIIVDFLHRKCAADTLSLSDSIKGSLTREFRLQVFFINQCPPGP